MEEVTDEPLYRERVSGIDIGKAAMAATIRVPPDGNRSRRMQETRAFGTTKREVPRRHSGLQYRTPQQVRNEYLERQLTA